MNFFINFFFYMSVLHLAVIGGNINIVDFLIKNGAKIEIKDKSILISFLNGVFF